MSAGRSGTAAYQQPEDCAGTPQCDRPRSTPVDPADADAASERLRYVLRTDAPDGAPLPWLAERVFRGEPDRADRQWLRREAERQGHDVLRPTQRCAVESSDGTVESRASEPGYTWIFPTWERCLTGGQTDRDSVLDNSSGGSRQRPSRAAENAARSVERRRQFRRPEEWSGLLDALAAKHVGEERGGSERTRFNDRSRALRGADASARAFAGAAARGHRRGAVITATTDPTRYASVADATAELLADATALRRKVGRTMDCDGRPPGFTAVEPSSTGLPHVHIAVFGVDGRALEEQLGELRSYWVGRGRGHQVEVQPIRRVAPATADPLAWRWADDGSPGIEPGRSGCPPATYLAAGSRALSAVAACDADDLRTLAAAERDGGHVPSDGPAVDAARTAAWYFATGLKAATRASPVLRRAAPEASASDLLRAESTAARPRPVGETLAARRRQRASEDAHVGSCRTGRALAPRGEDRPPPRRARDAAVLSADGQRPVRDVNARSGTGIGAHSLRCRANRTAAGNRSECTAASPPLTASLAVLTVLRPVQTCMGADCRIPVSRETRRKLRQRKAGDGRTYDELLREEFLNDD